MTELDNSVKTITFENIRFYVVKKLNDFYISRREVYKFFNRKTSVSLNSLFRIKSNYLGSVDKIEDAGFVIKDNGKEEKLSNTFLKIKDLIDVIKFYSKNNLKYSQKFSKFKNYLEFINLQFNMLGEKFYTDLDVFYRLKCKSDNSLEYYYIAKGLQGINKNNRLINVFQSSNGDLRVEIEQLIDNLEWYSTVKDKRESDFANKAISIKGEFSDSQGDCYLDSNTIIRPIKYVTFTGLEKFFFNRLSKFYPAYRKWYESVVYPNFPNSKLLLQYFSKVQKSLYLCSIPEPKILYSEFK